MQADVPAFTWERLLDGIDDAVFALSQDNGIVYANRSALGLLGTRADRDAKNLGALDARFEVFDERERPLTFGAFAGSTIDGARTERREATVRVRDRASGRERWMTARTTFVQLAPADALQAGGADRIVSLSDATDHRRSLDELRVSQEWFSTTLKSIGDAVIATDHEGRVTFMNEVAEELTGWPDAEARGVPLKTVFHIVNEQTRFEVESPVTKVLREGVVVGLANHTILIRRDGAELAIDDSGAPIRDASGKLVGVVLVFRDFTAKRREEERRLFLSEASAVLASSLEYATTLRTVAELAVPRVADWCLVQVRNDDGSIVPLAFAHVNPAKTKWLLEVERRYATDAAAASGVAAVLRTGTPELRERVSDDDLRSWARDDEHLMLLRRIGVRTRMIVPMRARHRTFGTITLGGSEASRPFGPEDLALAEQLARVAAVAIDNASLYADAQEASRAKDEFLATLSHELRTPLNAILGWTRMLRLRPGDPDRSERGLLIVERNARAQARLIDDLLDVSRIVTGKLALDVRTVDIPAVIEAAVDALRPAAEAKSVRVHLTLDRLLPPYAGDPDRLQQMAWNLVSNAVKFTPRGGDVWVDLRRVGSQIELRVRDSGPGIAPEFLPFVFDRFRQADASTTKIHMGLGLGLSIVKALVELHGGTVRAESAGAGQGAVFTITLPLTTIKDDDHVSMPPPGPLPSLHGARVLVVDDEEDNRETIAVLLQESGAHVVAVASAAEAMAAVEAVVPHVVVSDVGMPGEDGHSLIRRIRALPAQRGGRVPAIALTAHARSIDRTDALRAGFQDHLSKPIDPAELIIAVAKFAFGPSIDPPSEGDGGSKADG